MNPRDHSERWFYFGLIALTLGVFGQSVRFDFVDYDDPFNVTENAQVLRGMTVDGVVWALTSCDEYWRPWTRLSHMMDAELFGVRAGGHHLTNVWLHMAAVLLLFRLMRRLSFSEWSSAWIAALFAVHPMRVESVMWVTERKDVLSGVFFMLTLLAYVRYVRALSWGRYVMVCMMFLGAVGSKPTVVTLPSLLLLLDWWLGRPERMELSRPGNDRWRDGARVWLRLVLEKVPLLLLAMLPVVLTAETHNRMGFERMEESLPVEVRWGTAAMSSLMYVWRLVWPAGLAVYYPHPMSASWTQVICAVAAGLGITAGVLVLGRWRRELVLGWGWYVLMLIPPVGVMAAGGMYLSDRYVYLALIGLTIMVSGIVNAPMFWPRVLGAIMVTLYAAGAFYQAQYWSNSLALFRRALVVDEANYVAHHGVAVALDRQREMEAALFHARRSVELKPKYVDGWVTLGNLLASRERMAEAETAYRRALELNPDVAETWANFGVAQMLHGQWDEARKSMERAIELDPRSAKAHYNLGMLLAKLGELSEAKAAYERVLALNQWHENARNNLANILAREGRYEEALKHYDLLLRFNPYHADAHNNRGSVFYLQGRLTEALAAYREAARLRPDRTDYRQNLERVVEQLKSGPTG